MKFIFVTTPAKARLVRTKYYKLSDALVPIEYLLGALTIMIVDKGQFAGCFSVNTIKNTGYLRYESLSDSVNANSFEEMCKKSKIQSSEIVELTAIAFTKSLGKVKRQLAYGVALVLCVFKGKVVIGATINKNILGIFKQVLTKDLGTASVVVEGHNDKETPIPLFICYAERKDIFKEFPKNILKKNWKLFLRWLKKVAK